MKQKNPKVKESPLSKLYIVAGNCGAGVIVAGLIALFLKLRMNSLIKDGKEKLAERFNILFWIFIGLGIAAFIGLVVFLTLALIKQKSSAKTENKPKNAGENKKREVFVVAGAIIKDGYVFAAQRGNKGETKFKWEFPGGKIEPGETPQEALARELQEELKIKVKVHERITNIVDEYPTQILHIDTYRCELLEGTPTLTEHINMAWSSKEELDQLEFSPADAPTLAKIKKLYL